MSLNEIHVNSSTSISLNDRFTIMQKIVPSGGGIPGGVGAQRRRSRSRSANGRDNNLNPQASTKNKQFLQQLEKKHKILAAMKLKRKSLKQNVPRFQGGRGRASLRNAASKTLNVSPNGKLRRTNSMTSLSTMKADIVNQPRQLKRLRRSNSTSNIAARLGFRRDSQNNQSVGGGQGGIRRRLNRGNLRRSNSRQNLQRSNSQQNLSRSNSRTNLQYLANLPQQKLQNMLRNIPPKTNLGGGRSPRRQRLNRSVGNGNGRKRDASINSRLGINRTNALAARRGGRGATNGGNNGAVLKGRIFRRSANQTANTNQGGIQNRIGRRGRSRSRSRAGQAGGVQQNARNQSNNNNNVMGNGRRGRSRSRSRSRKPVNGQGGGGGGQNPRSGRGGARGRPRGGRGGPPRGRSANRGGVQQTPKSKEDLDKELEQYMANTKSSLDHEMDQYMKDAPSF